MPPVEVMCSDRQREFLWHVLENPDVDTVAYGGARYGGKTFANCLAATLCCLKWEGIRVLMLRQVLSAAEANLGEELEKVFDLLGLGRSGYQKLVTRKQYRFPNGSYIQLGYCKLPDSWEIYKGLQFEFIFFEEATLFREAQYDGLRGSNRARRAGVKPKKVLTTNPDGIGMEWVKRRIIKEETRESGVVFIQSRVRDCLPTLERDPGYVLRELRRLPDWQRRQWELGDWDSVEGAFWSLDPKFFDPDVVIPPWAEVHVGIDPGYWPDAFAAVFVAKWETLDGKRRLHVFREVKRHRLNLRQQAQAVREVEQGFSHLYGKPRSRWADPAAWKRMETDDGLTTTTAHTWAESGMVVTAAFSNTRVAGWMLWRTLADDGVLTIDRKACPFLYAEMTGAVHGRASEDMDDACEDHLSDALRYLLVSVFAGGYRAQPKRTRESRRKFLLNQALGAGASAGG